MTSSNIQHSTVPVPLRVARRHKRVGESDDEYSPWERVNLGSSINRLGLHFIFLETPGVVVSIQYGGYITQYRKTWRNTKP